LCKIRVPDSASDPEQALDLELASEGPRSSYQFRKIKVPALDHDIALALELAPAMELAPALELAPDTELAPEPTIIWLDVIGTRFSITS
jgi:hypothetical protein